MRLLNSLGPVNRGRYLFGGLSVAAVIYLLVGAWVLTAGPSDPIAHTVAFLDHLASPWMLATYVVLLAFVAFGVWKLRDAKTIRSRSAIQYVQVLMLFGLGLSAIGWLNVKDMEVTARADNERQQEQVARLKAQQIGKWLVEREADAQALAASLARLPLDRLPRDGNMAQVVALSFAELLAANPERVGIYLFAPDGTVLVRAGEGDNPDGPVIQAVLALARDPLTAPRIVDLYDPSARPGQPRMAFLAPVGMPRASERATGFVAMITDPFRGLLDNIQSWTTPSATSEVLVVHRQGDDVVFITPPELSPRPPRNSWRRPLSDSFAAAKAVMLGDGVRSGPDYRGVEVLAGSQRVNGLPWVVIAKTDSSEYALPLRRRERSLAVVIGTAVLLVAVILLVLWQGEQAVMASEQKRAETDHTALSRHFTELMKFARDMILLIDPFGRVIDANMAAIAAYGYSEAELRRLTVAELRTAEEYRRYEQDWRAGEAPDGVLVETVHRRKDGTTFPVEVSGRTLEVDGKRYRQVFIRDISVRKRLERQVARLSQVKSALQAATSVLLRGRSENEIHDQICEVVVRLGGYRMANVAVPVEDAERSVRTAAVAGADDGYLAQAGISWGDGPRGQGPTGTALRIGQTQVNQDFAVNPRTAPWRDAALAHGFHSSIALPLKVGGKVAAALTLYAAEPDAFGSDEVALLEALADDIAFAVAKLRPTAPA